MSEVHEHCERCGCDATGLTNDAGVCTCQDEATDDETPTRLGDGRPTLKELEWQVTDEQRHTGWLKQHNLAVDLHEHTGLKFEHCRELVAAACTGLPVVLTTRLRHLREEHTQTVIITRVVGADLDPLPSWAARVDWRSWGFMGSTPLGDVVSVEAPPSEYRRTDV